MSFLLDQDTCQGWIRGVARLRSRFAQHQDKLHVAAPTVIALTSWLFLRTTPLRYQQNYMSLMQQARVIALERRTAEDAASLQFALRGTTPRLSIIDLMVVAIALNQQFTLVTHDMPH